MPIPRLRPYDGRPLFSDGFRPFFLFGALYAGAGVLRLAAGFRGALALLTAFTPRDWHVHEMLYGYVPAVVTGFPADRDSELDRAAAAARPPLIVLFAAWIAGRIAVTVSGTIGWLAAARSIDVAFCCWSRPRRRARSRRQQLEQPQGRAAIVSLLALGNVAFHLEAHVARRRRLGIRLGIALVILLITLIGGRIVPSFTRNWLARENPGRLPAPLDASTRSWWR